jgi:predicted nucleotidyltransferase
MSSSGRAELGDLLNRRREQTLGRFAELRDNLTQADGICRGKACVYATGSFARGEASQHSDLDLFIVGQGRDGRRTLGRLDEILLKADLIEVTRRLKIPEFSGDGQYLVHYTAEQLVRSLGKPEDDATNTFTARLLMILESRPLLEAEVYRSVVDEVLGAYWQDFEDHRNEFVPAFLANDILRLWRTFCVNYEAGTARVPEEKRAKRRIKNYKLKHSRLLTCYSALLYLLSVYDRARTVTPIDASEMAAMTPTERIEWLRRQADLADAHAALDELLFAYERFLDSTDMSEAELIKTFLTPAARREYMEHAHRFGDLVFRVMEIVGRHNRFHRLLVV